MPPQRFEFEFAAAYRPPARVFNIKPANAWVQVDGGRMHAQFGPWHVDTPLTNIVAVARTGPYAFWKTAGSARLGFTDRGLTFATNGQRGLLITFATPVRGMDPFGLMRHPELTVTVADIDGLAAALRRP